MKQPENHSFSSIIARACSPYDQLASLEACLSRGAVILHSTDASAASGSPQRKAKT
jgi:hypothetical protein